MNPALLGPESLAGKVALVTGGLGGIGVAITAALRAAGARTIAVDRERDDHPDSVACDVADPEAVGALIAQVEREHGALDVLVHCAGITRDGVLWKLTREHWNEVLRVNLDSAFYLLQESAHLLRRSQGGSVVLISSINGERGKFGQTNYAASKAGLIGLARSAARELGRDGVRVNVVAPGLIATRMTEALPESILQAAIAETALGCAGRPEDVAGAVLFLCSDLSRHVTGQVLRVDGGQLMA